MGAALVVPALLLAAACGSEDSSDSDNGGGKAAAVTKVTGDFGEKPKIKFPDGAEAADEVVVKTLSEGDGDKVGKGDQVRLDFAGKAMKDDQALGSTWAKPAAQGGQQSAGGPRQQVIGKIGEPNQALPPPVLDSVAGHTVGSRLLVEGTAGALVGENLNPESGIEQSDGLVWVIDVVGAEKVDAKAELKGESAEPREGMPDVEVPAGKAAKITVPDGAEAPKELKEQVLIEGKGAEVKAGEGLIAQYTGYAWEDGKKFDSSWDNSGATVFQIGTGMVVEGWDKGLVGKHVGDRVLLVVPPELGYGKSEGNELQKKTLIFVVDILGTV
ncbi:FKBP-type peptidyl-prolyl cis-trans isomerase [Streptomyces sp. MAR4 CNX-425]|uniref:FKBP-type peptidyl-prolyl cis-trans isomerase n=1 Tax=Streptomyces sp. MAR4 CNX-425 TaxID=3406343 RepID=UPI003B5099FB